MSAWRPRATIRFDDDHRHGSRAISERALRDQSRLGSQPATCSCSRGPHVTKLIAIMALGASLAGCVSSPLTPAPIVQMAPPGGVPARPASAPQDPGKCIHDEGYGRWTDCGSEV